MAGLKLYHCTVETELYCLAESQHEAMAVAREHYGDEEPDITAYEASSVDTDWYDGLPHHRRRELPDKTCAEWLEELNGVKG
jgi:hypothetical protein